MNPIQTSTKESAGGANKKGMIRKLLSEDAVYRQVAALEKELSVNKNLYRRRNVLK